MTSFLSCDKCVDCRPRITNMKSNVRNRVKTELNRSVINFLLPCISAGQKNFLGRGTFAVVAECKYKNNIGAVKKLHSNLTENVTNIFTKEALLFRRISSKNVLKILGVCENPISIIMEHLEFSFVPFARDIKVNFLDDNHKMFIFI